MKSKNITDESIVKNISFDITLYREGQKRGKKYKNVIIDYEMYSGESCMKLEDFFSRYKDFPTHVDGDEFPYCHNENFHDEVYIDGHRFGFLSYSVQDCDEHGVQNGKYRPYFKLLECEEDLSRWESWNDDGELEIEEHDGIENDYNYKDVFTVKYRNPVFHTEDGDVRFRLANHGWQRKTYWIFGVMYTDISAAINAIEKEIKKAFPNKKDYNEMMSEARRELYACEDICSIENMEFFTPEAIQRRKNARKEYAEWLEYLDELAWK